MTTLTEERATLCKDRLPELILTDSSGYRVSDRVLVGTLDEEIVIGELCQLDADPTWIDDNADVIHDVICWRPLPRMF